MTPLYLASRSPRRRQLLEQIGVRFQPLTIDVLEQPHAEEDAVGYVQRLAREKSLAGQAAAAALSLPDGVVLGADTLGECDGQILEKPADRDEAVAMLMGLADRSHRVLSAVAVCKGDVLHQRLSISTVSMGPISEETAIRYWKTGEPADKAGSYGIQGYGAVFVTSITGSYSGIVGLPLKETAELLELVHVETWGEKNS